jgi:hypothetical protein
MSNESDEYQDMSIGWMIFMICVFVLLIALTGAL